jgi:hypothetical protein
MKACAMGRGDAVSERWINLEDRRGLLCLLAGQVGVSGLCVDATITPCGLVAEVVEIGVTSFELGEEVNLLSYRS